MAYEPVDMTLELLRAIRADLGDVKARLTALDAHAEGTNERLANLTHAVNGLLGVIEKA